MSTAALLSFAEGSVPGPETMLRVLLVVLLSQVPVGALNDVLDQERDRTAGRDKPIAQGQVSSQPAVVVSSLSLVLLPVASMAFGAWSVVLALVGTSAGLAYDAGLKRTPASVLCYLVAFSCLVAWIWLVAGRLSLRLLLLLPLAALVLLAAHLSQTLPDVESDRAAGERGLAATLGAGPAIWLTLLAGATVGAIGLGVSIIRAAPLAIPPDLALLVASGAWAYRWRRLMAQPALRVYLFRTVVPLTALAAIAVAAAVRGTIT